MKSKEVFEALNDLVKVTDTELHFKSKSAAEEISQLYLDNTDFHKGSIYGPYLANQEQPFEWYWIVEK